MNLFPRFFACLSCLTTSLFAAEGSRPIEIRALLNDPVNPGAVFQIPTAPGVFGPLELIPEGLSKPKKIEIARDTVALYGPQPADPKALPPVIASAAIPSTMQRGVLIIAPEVPGGKLPYRMVVVEDSPQAFPFGESRVVNMTIVPMAAQVGSNKVSLPPNKVSTLPAVKEVNEFNIAQTNFYMKAGESWKPIAERQLQYLKSMRRIFIIFATPGAVAPTLRTVTDDEPPEPVK